MPRSNAKSAAAKYCDLLKPYPWEVEPAVVYAILCWHPQGAYWLRGKARKGDRLKVLTFDNKSAAEYCASLHDWYGAGVTKVEVLEYNGDVSR